MPVLRVPYTDPLPLPRIIPSSANTLNGAIEALTRFLLSSPPAPSPSTSASITSPLRHLRASSQNKTAILTGAGISVASGLADYRGTNGTYTLNKTYRPIYYNEFATNHEARKRYWARSFLGWTTLDKARPNEAHAAVGKLGELGICGGVVTQNVDSFHLLAHPSLPTTELHGYLRSLVCLTCHSLYPRSSFQNALARLNPLWSSFLADILASGALDTENPEERRRRGLKTNPDGDVDIPNAPYTTFRYPACPVCLEEGKQEVAVDEDGAWVIPTTPSFSSSSSSSSSSSAKYQPGILKPAVTMFGESIDPTTKTAAESLVDSSSKILVVGSSLATYSAWRLVKRAKERGMPIGILNIGGARGEESFFADLLADRQDDERRGDARFGFRASQSCNKVLPEVVRRVERELGRV